jgi:hypothetical protein
MAKKKTKKKLKTLKPLITGYYLDGKSGYTIVKTKSSEKMVKGIL